MIHILDLNKIINGNIFDRTCNVHSPETNFMREVFNSLEVDVHSLFKPTHPESI